VLAPQRPPSRPPCSPVRQPRHTRVGSCNQDAGTRSLCGPLPPLCKPRTASVVALAPHGGLKLARHERGRLFKRPCAPRARVSDTTSGGCGGAHCLRRTTAPVPLAGFLASSPAQRRPPPPPWWCPLRAHAHTELRCCAGGVTRATAAVDTVTLATRAVVDGGRHRRPCPLRGQRVAAAWRRPPPTLCWQGGRGSGASSRQSSP